MQLDSANPDNQKNPKIFLYCGEEIPVTFSDGLYRAKVGDRNYCSILFSGLMICIGYFHSIYTSFDKECPVLSVVHSSISTLLSSNILEYRQNALQTLRSYPDDPDAAAVVGGIERKHTSFGATYITRCLGKKDFSSVTVEEICDLVPNILHRSELIKELSERVRHNA